MTKNASLVRVLIAYVVAFAAAAAWLAWGPSTDKLWLDTLIADLIATLVIFGFSRAYKNSSFYDAYWSVIPPAIFIYWWIETDAEGATYEAHVTKADGSEATVKLDASFNVTSIEDGRA